VRLIDGLPSDTAARFDPGSILIMDLHVLNPSAQEVRTEVRINLWTVPESQIAAFDCSRTQQMGACQTQCSSGTACTSCIQQNFQKELAACANATCD
jgi:hypothetical protein